MDEEVKRLAEDVVKPVEFIIHTEVQKI